MRHLPEPARDPLPGADMLACAAELRNRAKTDRTITMTAEYARVLADALERAARAEARVVVMRDRGNAMAGELVCWCGDNADDGPECSSCRARDEWNEVSSA